MARQSSDLEFPTLAVLDVAVERNGFGRQTDSFEADLAVPALDDERPYHAVFIRAPVVESVGESVEVLARLPEDAGKASGSAVALRQGPHLATTFHPELTDDDRFHRYFVDIVRREARGSSPK
jgi:5'-phosphate synthase pdxT subunit